MERKPASSVSLRLCALSSAALVALLLLSYREDDGAREPIVSPRPQRDLSPPVGVVPIGGEGTLSPPVVPKLPIARREVSPTIAAGRSANRKKATNATSNIVGMPTALSHKHECREVGKKSPDVHFQQVLTYVGPVPIQDIESALRDIKAIPHVTVIALDGTLLNLLRWGRIVNDNDVDLGFVVDAAYLRNARVNSTASDGDADGGDVSWAAHYWALQDILGAANIIHPVTDRDRKKLLNRNKVVKPGKCKLRGSGMMQCRHKNGVIFDLFGPDSLFHPQLSPWRAVDEFMPIAACRCFDFEFPCPKHPIDVLQKFTINVAEPNSPPKGSYEFTGCALYPKRSTERDAMHTKSIDRTVVLLDRCGYPSLVQQINSSECRAIRGGDQ